MANDEIPAERTYYGYVDDSGDEYRGRIQVVTTATGPTERQRNSRVLYELRDQHHDSPMWWGYAGGSPSRAAVEILADALGERPTNTYRPLLKGFLFEVISQLPDGFRIRRSLILRWVRDFCRENELPMPPGATDSPAKQYW